MNNIIEALNRRYATKKFDTNKKINQEDFTTLLESLRLAPSSFGLQPWKFIHVKTPEIRTELQNNSRGQAQVTEASDLIVIAVKTTMDENDVEEYTQSIQKIRAVNVSEISEADIKKLLDYKNMMIGTITSRTPEQIKSWNQKQAYIAMGFLLETCAILGIDACPMEGFDPNKYDEILGLDKLGLTATVVIPVGYRSSEDKYADLTKVRFDKEEVVIEK
ncbi:nitroreductase [candidate division SR1 bacterium RAAC1_SR1_1]|nr:nitroreductase [candidate division SR1 bacterium RAAC1_SR1_1]